jgi:hypothetical protein
MSKFDGVSAMTVIVAGLITSNNGRKITYMYDFIIPPVMPSIVDDIP